MIKEKFYRSGYFNDTISSTILFIVAYLFVLYVSLFSTAFISFTNQITIPMEIDKIDFERASSSSDAVWESAENVFTIFSFSPLVVFILGLLAVIATKKTQNKNPWSPSILDYISQYYAFVWRFLIWSCIQSMGTQPGL